MNFLRLHSLTSFVLVKINKLEILGKKALGFFFFNLAVWWCSCGREVTAMLEQRLEAVAGKGVRQAELGREQGGTNKNKFQSGTWK